MQILQGGVNSFLLAPKISIKSVALLPAPSRNYRLFRSTFPEVNKQMPLYFLKTRTKTAFVMLLAAWHMDWLAEAIFWIKEKMRAAKGQGKECNHAQF